MQSVLSQFSEVPGAEGSLERLLPSIVSCFGGGKAVVDSIAALKVAAASSELGGKSSLATHIVASGHRYMSINIWRCGYFAPSGP